jgi:hypothetical protein
MPQFITHLRSIKWSVALLCLTAASLALAASPQATQPATSMAHISGHMFMTSLRPPKPGDQQKANAIAAAAKQAMAPYQDYRKALADGYVIFLPNVPQHQYHFTKAEYGLEARSHFDPLKPTSLLYTKTPDGGYKLVGAMYTDRVDASEDELNDRIRSASRNGTSTSTSAKPPKDRKPPTSAPTQNSACSDPLPRRKPARPQAANSIPTSLAGWSTSTPTKPTVGKSGQPTMTTRATTTWITPPCPE